MKIKTIAMLLLSLTLLLTACNANQTDQQSFQAAATQTASVLTQNAPIPATQTSSPTPPPQPTATIKLFPSPTMIYPPISSTQIIVRTPTAACYKLEIQSETYEDGTVVYPGEKFRKVWELKNTGSCTWEEGTALVYNRGVDFNANANLLLSDDVPPGETYEVGIYLTAPETPGLNTGYWYLRTPDNVFFGWGDNGENPLWAQVVVPGATYTPTNR